jgi:Phage derived protein Gp49-like (DUF891)
MTLLQLERTIWTVLAFWDDSRDECPVLEVLRELSSTNHGAVKMLRTLLQRVPEHGPEFSNEEKVRKLKGKKYSDLWEFREQPSKGPKVRVLFFRDEKVVVCTEAFEKRSSTPKPALDRAVALRKQYFSEKPNHAVRRMAKTK